MFGVIVEGGHTNHRQGQQGAFSKVFAGWAGRFPIPRGNSARITHLYFISLCPASHRAWLWASVGLNERA